MLTTNPDSTQETFQILSEAASTGLLVSPEFVTGRVWKWEGLTGKRSIRKFLFAPDSDQHPNQFGCSRFLFR